MAWNDDLWSALFSVALIGHVLAFVVFGVLLPALQQQQQQQRQDSISHPADDVTANAAGTAPAPAAAEYEFTDAQERIISARRRVGVGVIDGFDGEDGR